MDTLRYTYVYSLDETTKTYKRVERGNNISLSASDDGYIFVCLGSGKSYQWTWNTNTNTGSLTYIGIHKIMMQGNTAPLEVVNGGVTIPTIAGPQGIQGVTGLRGLQGADGPQGPAGANCIEISEADVRAMFDNYLSDPESVTTDELVCMRKELDRLIEQREDYTDFPIPPKICGQPYVLFGAGTPQLSIVPTNWIPIEKGGYVWNGTPVALGQMYVNTSVSSGGVYIAAPSEVYDLKWINI